MSSAKEVQKVWAIQRDAHKIDKLLVLSVFIQDVRKWYWYVILSAPIDRDVNEKLILSNSYRASMSPRLEYSDGSPPLISYRR